ncbi:hypothetical protein [Azospirillum endophyticum]
MQDQNNKAQSNVDKLRNKLSIIHSQGKTKDWWKFVILLADDGHGIRPTLVLFPLPPHTAQATYRARLIGSIEAS